MPIARAWGRARAGNARAVARRRVAVGSSQAPEGATSHARTLALSAPWEPREGRSEEAKSRAGTWTARPLCGARGPSALLPAALQLRAPPGPVPASLRWVEGLGKEATGSSARQAENDEEEDG